MKNFAVGLAVLGLIFGGAPVARAQNATFAATEGAPEAELSAAQVIERAAESYARLTVYRGQCAATLYAIDAEEEGPREINLATNSSIQWERGRSLRIATDNGGQKWSVEGDAREIVMEDSGIPMLRIQPSRRVFVDEKNIGKVDSFIIALRSQALGTGTLTLELLEDFRFLHPFKLKGEPQLQPGETVGDRPCYVVARREEGTDKVTTLWLDKQSFLLRRMTVEQGEIVRKPIEIQGRIIERNHTLRDSRTYLFSIEEAR